MSLKTSLIKPYARRVSNNVDRWSRNAVSTQKQWMQALLRSAEETVFGKEHQFTKIHNYEDFKARIPITEYEGLRPYIDRTLKGEKNVLWQGLPMYFAKTSGTTSGIKYIPLTRESVPNHIDTARNAVFNFGHKKGDLSFFDGNQIFLSGSPEMAQKGKILTGRLSGIVNHQVPKWLRMSQMPSYETNCIEDWETKLDKIVQETLSKDMRLISGIPPWVVMYFERILEETGKANILEVFPNFNMFVYGGVNFKPYQERIDSLIGKEINSLETYPASEGFIAFQDTEGEGLLLNTHSGIFFEFVPAEEIHNESPTRLTIEEVELGVNYAIIISTNAGLWGYNLGDTVQFVSRDPYRIVVSGRIKHFISAFGEHVIGKEVETALQEAIEIHGGKVNEFTVAPQVAPPEGGLPYHEWFIEFDEAPADLSAFTKTLDTNMVKQNIYYEDLIVGNILTPLKVRPLSKDSFVNYMKSIGKLGGQNKVPRLANDRKIADVIMKK